MWVMSKCIIIFDEEILQNFKYWIKKDIEIYRWNNNFLYNTSFEYWFNVFDWRRTKKVLIKYMFSKRKRVQKKFDKKYSYYKEIKVNWFPYITASA